MIDHNCHCVILKITDIVCVGDITSILICYRLDFQVSLRRLAKNKLAEIDALGCRGFAFQETLIYLTRAIR